MGFLSGVTEKLFGGTDNSAQKMQQQANQKSQAWIEQMAALGRGDANALYPAGDYARNTGINAAMALMGQSMPAQMGMFQDGNVSAQMQLLAGMPQYQNAILGQPVNNQALQPYRSAMPDPSSYRTQLPDFGQPQQPAAGQPWQWQNPNQAPVQAQQMPQQQLPQQQPQQGGLPPNAGIPPNMLAMFLGGGGFR